MIDTVTWHTHSNMTDIALSNMLTRQIRTWNVLSDRVLGAFTQIPREKFVDDKYRHLAYADTELPIGYGQTMLSPKLEAHILQSLDPQANQDVLLIGTGSGYLSALLSVFARRVDALENNTYLSEAAQKRLHTLNIQRVICHTQDGILGFPERAPYDVIVLTGSVHSPPVDLLKQLKLNGRLFAVVGSGPVMRAMLFQPPEYPITLFETYLPPLMVHPTPSSFSF